ncbi:O-antigen ligase family protein [Salinithrix halophila]|uniref:O-antigen ligase family protein n=1 Tax=Salinithrix halophila TaxID=1485204 RepID=A0ABV8JGL5_9BACL
MDSRHEKLRERWVQFLYISILFSPVLPAAVLLLMGIISPYLLKGKWKPFGWPERIFLAFVVLSTVSWVFNPYLLFDWLPVAVVPILSFGLYVILSVWMKRGLDWTWVRYQKLYTMFWIAGLYPAIVTILQRVDWMPIGRSAFFYFLGFYPMQAEGVRSIGPALNSNLAAALLICLALLSIYATSLARNRWEKAGAFFIFFVHCGAIWCTGSRGAWVGLVLGLLVQVWMTGKRKRAVAFFLGLVAAAMVIATNKTLIPREDTLLATYHVRKFVWQNSFEIFRENWLIGVLPLHFSSLFEVKTGKLLFHAHNVFLGIASEYGIFGLFLFLTLIVVTTARARRWRKTANDRKEKRLAGVLISIIFALLGHGMYDYPIIAPQLGLIFMSSVMVINAQFERRCLRPPWCKNGKENGVEQSKERGPHF